MQRPDALTLANQLDDAWHDQPRSFEREAITRFWGLLTLSARVLDPAHPRTMLRHATVVRNGRFRGDAVHRMFFSDKDFTEVDALFMQVGSALGHPTGDDAWVVEVERKSSHQQGDYYVAIQRAEKFAKLLSAKLNVRARPVVIYEDAAGKYTAHAFEGDVRLIPMSALRSSTAGLRFPALADLPGLACDKTLVKLMLLKQLVARDPNHPRWYQGALQLAHDAASYEGQLHLPLVGHQDLDALPNQLPAWLARERESDTHLSDRIQRYLQELHQAGALARCTPAPTLSAEGGNIALQLLHAEREALT